MSHTSRILQAMNPGVWHTNEGNDMYAIKASESKRKEYYEKSGLVLTLPRNTYVSKDEYSYTTKDNAKTWETEEEAASHITEPWEEVVQI